MGGIWGALTWQGKALAIGLGLFLLLVFGLLSRHSSNGPPRSLALPPKRFEINKLYKLTLMGTGAASIKSTLGDPLDGEQKQFPSGDGIKGGDFILKFEVLPIP